MTVRIVTDSACDISLDDAAQLNVKIVPLSIRFGEEEFTDLADITVTEFYEKMDLRGRYRKNVCFFNIR